MKLLTFSLYRTLICWKNILYEYVLYGIKFSISVGELND